jgi:sec-independent protein translocase protein TatA
MGGITGILLIVIVFLLVSGFSKLPEVGSGLGRSIRNFKRSLNEPGEIDVTPQDTRTNKHTPDK